MKRRPVVSGAFYPSSKKALDDTLSLLFKGVKPGSFRCVVSPHAGYVYSGATAAKAIGSLAPAKTFVILGPNHHMLGPDFSVMSDGEWETPLGEVKVDGRLARELIKGGILKEDSLAHAHEHSIEVQLPFLQHRFKDFSIVPVSIGGDYSGEFLERCEALGKHIAEAAKGKSVGIIASSDFSHYLPVKVAEAKDAMAIEKINKLDAKGFFETLESIDASVCGYAPIAVAMAAAKAMGMKQAKVISRSNSGDATGDRSSVVAYYAIGFE